MWTATRRGLGARKVRLALTALAVTLGVAFTAGTLVLTDTLAAAIDRVFAQTGARVDLVVQARSPVGADVGGERLPDSLVARIRGVPGVAAAEGTVLGPATLVVRGRAVQRRGAPTIGMSWGDDPAVGPLRLVAGRRPLGRGETAVDTATARREGIRVGDRVGVVATGAREDFRVVGLLRLGDADDLGPVTVSAFALATAQRLFDATGLVDAVQVRIAEGARRAEVAAALRDLLGPAYQVRGALVVAREQQRPLQEALGVLSDALLGFGAIGLLVGGFIIFNTFAILVAQRTRELGLLRALGAGRAQVVGSVVAEGAVVGLVAGALGIGGGVVAGRTLLWLLPRLDLPVPVGPAVVQARTVLVGLAVGVGVTVVAVIGPAVRAARVPPLAAITEPLLPGRRRVRLGPGLAVTAAGLGVAGYGIGRVADTPRAVAVTFLGCFLAFCGLVLVGPRLLRPVARVTAGPFRALAGVTGRLAAENAARNPRRTTATAAALVIGVSLVTLVAIFAASVRASIGRGIDRGVQADAVISAPQLAGFSPRVRAVAQRTPGVRAAVAMRFGRTVVDGRDELLTGVSTSGLTEALDLDVRAGSLRALRTDGVLVSARAARRGGWRVGDRMLVGGSAFGARELVVRGVFANARVTGAFPVSLLVGMRTFDSVVPGVPQDTLVYVRFEPDRPDAAAALRRRLHRSFPNVTLADRAEFRTEREAIVDQFLNVILALLALSGVIALLGIANTLVLSVHERTRELGLLRVVGMRRDQVRRMVRLEAVLIAVVGTAVGIGGGIAWGWAVVQALEGRFVDTFTVPVSRLAVFAAAGALVGVAAAAAPAWRASRLDVLAAIAHE
jgi:putative ABC transport system permease protein